ncbi:SpoIIE family protein phosphatase [Streptomyces sp. NPDC005435]|uniref:PP2C family protein-serine/threonine phosphatase n=1 Tax=Streptomyces sp. NPDC005435 TaxID=3154464 RepID=UPI003456988F
MPSPVSADRPAAQPPGRGSVEALISQTRRLKGDMAAVRRDTPGDGSAPEERWQRALYELALHQLDDLDAHLAQLRDGPERRRPEDDEASPLGRVGSAEWNLLTDGASWSPELYGILGLDPDVPALTLDELPSLVHEEDRPRLTAMTTACLVDARPIDGEFRVVRPDTSVRTVHMMGEPVLDADGGTVSMWAVLRDVSELRRRGRTVRETGDSLQLRQRPLVAPGETLLHDPLPSRTPPPLWSEPARRGTGALDIAARHLPSESVAAAGGDWCDALELPDGTFLLSAGDLTGQHGSPVPAVAVLLGAVRGMALSGTGPGRLLTVLDQVLDASAPPARLSGAVCCHYAPENRTLTWADTGHPAPLLFRDGTGHVLTAPDGAPGTAPGQAEVALEQGDLLLLHTEGLLLGADGATALDRLLGLGPLLDAASTAPECARIVAEAFGTTGRAYDACLLVARVTAQAPTA